MRDAGRRVVARPRDCETADLPIAPAFGKYSRWRPQDTVLYRVVQENYRSFVAGCEEADPPLPRLVSKEFEESSACGVFSNGLARVHCFGCGYDRLVGLSCKRRSLCPSCLGRRMNGGAAYLADCVLGATLVRHWVLTLPPPLRYLLAYEPSLVTEVLEAFIDSVFQCFRWKAKECFGLRCPRFELPMLSLPAPRGPITSTGMRAWASSGRFRSPSERARRPRRRRRSTASAWRPHPCGPSRPDR